MSRSELEHFVAIMDSGCDEVNDLDDLINLTYNLDNYDFIPDIKDYDDLGRYYFFEGGYNIDNKFGSFVDYHAYRSNRRTYREMRQLSDEICKEHGLSVIPPSQSKGMDYKEYTEAKRGTSWKQKLKQTIDRCIITAKD